MNQARILTAVLALSFSTNVMAVPITEADLGELDGVQTEIGILNPFEVLWFSFTVDNFTFLNIDTFETFRDQLFFDTSLGLYDALGNLLFENGASNIDIPDDGCEGSDLDFCAALFLFAGDVSPGTYYLALGGFDTLFGSAGFDVTSSCMFSCDGGPDREYVITFSTDNSAISVPEPGTLALLGIGLLGMGLARRRRKV